ncbi:MAG: peptidase MA family metallohydrolase [Chloroflexi bacterium]|nr:peptidase MA family metallohydrolase [Chloroflexota bacterium]
MRRRVVRGPLIALLVALALVGTLATPAAAELDSAVLTTEVTFGSGITFHMEMPHAAAEPAGVEVRYGLPDSIVVRRSAAEFAVADGLLRATYAWEPRDPLVVGTEVEYRFVIRSADGSESRTAPAAVTYVDATLPWTTASEGLVEIWYYAGGEAVEADARAGIRAALEILRDSFGAELERPTRLFLYADIATMRRDLGGGASPWVGGAAIADLNVTVLHAPVVNRDSLDLQATVAHEITHIVLEHRTHNSFGGLPAWLHEGLATTVEAEITERFSYGDIMTRLVAEGNFVSLRGITGSFPADSQAAVNAYAQSNSLVTYIIETWGREGVAALLEAYAGGVSDDEAVQAALGVSLQELDRAWLGTHGVVSPTFESLAQPEVAVAMASPDGEGSSPAGPAPEPVAAAAVAFALVAAAATVLLVRRGRVARGYARH